MTNQLDRDRERIEELERHLETLKGEPFHVIPHDTYAWLLDRLSLALDCEEAADMLHAAAEEIRFGCWCDVRIEPHKTPGVYDHSDSCIAMQIAMANYEEEKPQ